ncbi:MAG: hypothetical protein V1855_03680, partial [bacterium]
MKKITSLLIFCFLFPLANTKIDESKLFNRATKIRARYGNDLCNAEQEIKEIRMQKAYETLQTFLDQSFDAQQTPNIGIVCSGGGYRAAVATLSMLQGLEEIGLLDAASYISSLSGSTWSLASWVYQEASLGWLEKFLRKQMQQSFYPHNLEINDIANTVFAKITSGRIAGLNDIYGGILANIFLKTKKDPGGQNCYLSNLVPKISEGQYPFPIFTAIISNESDPYPWMEFTPLEVGSTYLETWIPTWACGKQFKEGVSTDTRYEETFGFMLGMWGSAYAASVYDAVNVITNGITAKYNINLPTELFSWINGFWFANTRIAFPKIYNFSYKVEHSPLRKDKYLILPDAGCDMNLPFIPLFRRDVDVYIVCDASGGLAGKTTPMQQIKAFADNHYIQFPSFDAAKLQKKTFDIIIDKENSFAPIIIYVKNTFEISTFDLDYTEKEFNEILANVKKSIINNVDSIKTALTQAIQIKAEGYRKKIVTPKK